MSFAELDRMILTNLADIDATVLRLEELQIKVWKEIDKCVKSWAEANGWTGLFDADNGGLWVAPAHWNEIPDQKHTRNAIWLDDAEGKPETHFQLADFCGIGGSRYGFQLLQQEFKPTAWKSLARKNAEIFKSVRFPLGGKGDPFIPLVLDAGLLADALETGDFTEALAPVSAALEIFAKAEEVITNILFPKRAR